MSDIEKLPAADGCPVCFHRLDAATDARFEGARPKPGDLSICISCTTVLKFDDALRHVLLTNEELASLDPEMRAELQRVRSAIRHVTQPWPGKPS